MLREDDVKAEADHRGLPLSLVFPGKTICLFCGLPVLPELATKEGLCPMCERDAQSATAIAVMTEGIPARGFKAAIDEVRRAGRPLVLDVADAAVEELGGPSELGRMIASDLKAMRGEGLDESVRMHFDVDYKAVKGMYEALIRLLGERDGLVGNADPLDGVSEEDLMAIASQAAEIRIEVDSEYRKHLLELIAKLDPEAVLDAAATAIDTIDNRPSVFVMERS